MSSNSMEGVTESQCRERAVSKHARHGQRKVRTDKKATTQETEYGAFIMRWNWLLDAAASHLSWYTYYKPHASYRGSSVAPECVIYGR